MGRLSLRLVVVASACLALGTGQLAASAATPEHAVGTPAVPIVRTDLHARYEALLPTEGRHLHPVAITYARGHHGTARGTAPATCTEPACPLVYHGGDIQTGPQLYLLLWGPSWSTTGADAQYLDAFLSGLGSSTDAWSTTTEQYAGANGSPGHAPNQLQGIYQDTSTPPSGATQAQLQAEADAFYSAHGLSGTVNDQVIVATPSGTCPQGFYAPGCAGGTGSYCAYHTSGNYSETWTNLPYLLDAGSGCGENFVNAGSAGTYDGYSIVEGHEWAETVTDPYPSSGWRDGADGSGGEIGDKCAWNRSSSDVTLSTGSFAMQPLWSNAGNDCAMSTSVKPDAPTNAHASAGNASATVSWTAPAFDGGTGITGYLVTAADATNAGNGGQICSTLGATTCSVTGLTNGDSYSFTVVASNANGNGPPSAPSNSVVPSGSVTPPTVTSAPFPALKVLSRVGTSASSAALPVTVGWQYTAGSAPVCTVALQRSTNGGAWAAVSGASATGAADTLAAAAGKHYQYRLDLTDCDGGTTGWVTGTRFGYNLLQENVTQWHYSSTTAWKRVACSQCSGGYQRYTTAKNAYATLTLSNAYQVGLVMETGPTLGSAEVYVDGVGHLVNTNATTAGYRLVTLTAAWPGYGAHTVKVVDLASSGHPRIDVDAAAVLFGP